MKIGYSVEGSTDRALITGLKNRWCPDAELVEGKFRGQTETRRRAEMPRICQELAHKDVSLIVFLTDSNAAPWRQAKKDEEQRCPQKYHRLSVFGVCRRNVECWLSVDADYIANQLGRTAAEFRVEDPKGIVESAFGISGLDKQEEKIAQFVRQAPLRHWLSNASFEDFFSQLWQKTKELGCKIENLRDPS